MSLINSPSAQSADPSFYGIPKFFSDEMQKATSGVNDVPLETKEIAPVKTPAKVPFTPLELQFILYSKRIFAVSYPYEENCVTVEISKNMQDGFYEWIRHKYKDKNFQTDQKLDEIVSSIWVKSRDKVLHNLGERGTRQMVQHESECLADVVINQTLSQAQNKREWIFTGRQAKLIHSAARSYEIQLMHEVKTVNKSKL